MPRITRPLGLAASNQIRGFGTQQRAETRGVGTSSPPGLGVRQRGPVRNAIRRPEGSPVARARANKLAAHAPRFAQRQSRNIGQGRATRRPYTFF